MTGTFRSRRPRVFQLHGLRPVDPEAVHGSAGRRAEVRRPGLGAGRDPPRERRPARPAPASTSAGCRGWTGRSPCRLGVFRPCSAGSLAGATDRTTRSSARRCAYQYLTTLARARRYPGAPTRCSRSAAAAGGSPTRSAIGEASRGPGLPLVSATRWDTGVQAFAGEPARCRRRVAVTVGSLSRAARRGRQRRQAGCGTPDLAAVARPWRGPVAGSRRVPLRGVTTGCRPARPKRAFVQEAAGHRCGGVGGLLARCAAKRSSAQWTLPAIGDARHRRAAAIARPRGRGPVPHAAGAARRRPR